MPAIVAELNPVVTTASRKEEKALDAPASVAVIDVRDIQERTATTVADHVQGLAGVDVNKNGLASNNIVARGFNNAFSGSILTLQDYRFAAVPSLRVNAPFLFTAVSEDIERMEVLLGPASALYGPNSSHGVLHIITKSPFTSQGTTLTIDGGTRTLFRGGVRHAGLIGDKVGYKLSGEYFTAKEFEYEDPAEPDVFPSSAPAGRAGLPNERDFDASRFAGEARIDIRPNENSEYVSTVGFTRVGSELEYTGANGTAQVKGWRYVSLQQRARIGRLFGQVFANFSDAGNEDGNDLGGTYLLRSGQPIVDQSRLYAAQLQHGFGLWGGRQDFVYGLDYIKTEPRTGNTINGRNEDIDEVQEVGGYIQSTTQLTPMWDFLAALRLDNNDQIEGNQFSPRAALIFKPNASNNFRVTFNRAFSTPANFSFFLDLIQAANVGGTGFNVRALGNPPKRGWQFNRTCPATIAAGLCMMTPGTGTQWVPVVAAPAYGAVVNALSPRITTGLVQTFTAAPFNLPSAVATQLANTLVATMKQLNPTPAQIGTELRYLGSPAVVDPAALADIGPLKASFNNTWELGYKGIIANKLRLAVDLWTERRGDVGNPAGIATPSAFMDAASLQTFLTGPFTQVFQGVGQPPQQAAASAAAVAAAIAGNLSQAPVGIVQFNDPKFASGTDVYATYTSYNKEVTVNGADLAVDYVASNNLTLAATYSWVSDLVFENVTSSNGLALMLNAPDNKASLSVRWRDDTKGWGFDVRGRYFNGYPVNSGVYATNFDFPLSGQAGTFQYEPIKSSALLDLGVHWRLPVRGAQELLWSINADNVLNHPYRSMPGTPRLGRMVVSRLQYVF
jgi:iron complex outermembrane receptor protein